DDLQEIVNANMGKRMDCIEAANQSIDEIVEEYCEWLASRSLRPAIKSITYNMQKISKEELSNYNKINSEDVQLAIHEFSKHLTQKYTRLVRKNLKEMSVNGKNSEALKLIIDLFNIGNE